MTSLHYTVRVTQIGRPAFELRGQNILPKGSGVKLCLIAAAVNLPSLAQAGNECPKPRLLCPS